MKQKILSILVLLVFCLDLTAQNRPFITVWKTDNPGKSANNEIIFPIYPSCIIEWEDKNNPSIKGLQKIEVINGNVTDNIISFPKAGTYIVKVKAPKDSSIAFGYFRNPREMRDQKKLLQVTQWGNSKWIWHYNTFTNCENLDVTATDIPDLTKVKTMSSMFEGCTSLIGNSTFNLWNVSNVENMDHLFAYCKVFNQPIRNWNTRNVTKMEYMFAGAKSFNQPIGNWNVENVTDISDIFHGAEKFNQPLNNWNTTKITDMGDAFAYCTSFNQPLSNWKTESVRAMGRMFQNARSFNQSIGNWNMKNVEVVYEIFQNATSFNQDLSKWDLSSVENKWGTDMFLGATAYKGIDYSKKYTEPTVAKTTTKSENNTQPSSANQMNCKITISDYESKVSLALTNFQGAFAHENNWASCIRHLETALENMEKIENAYIGCKGRSKEINDQMRANMAKLKKGVVDDINQMKENFNYEPFRKMVWEMTPKLKQFFDDNTFSNL